MDRSNTQQVDKTLMLHKDVHRYMHVYAVAVLAVNCIYMYYSENIKCNNTWLLYIGDESWTTGLIHAVIAIDIKALTTKVNQLPCHGLLAGIV